MRRLTPSNRSSRNSRIELTSRAVHCGCPRRDICFKNNLGTLGGDMLQFAIPGGDWQSILNALLGGALIGLAASFLMLFKGRVFGVSGILGGIAVPRRGDTLWRVAALLGLVAAGGVLWFAKPDAVQITATAPLWQYALAGLLVGFGTQLGSGCTSGHGVCGISRLSTRSIVATATFMVAGILVVALMRGWGAFQ